MSNPFDFGGMGGLGGLIGGIQQRMEDMKKKAAETEVEGSASGGLVKVRMSCDFNVSAVTIDQKAYEDRELLEDLVRAATNDATDKARAEMQKIMQATAGGLGLPPGLLPGF